MKWIYGKQDWKTMEKGQENSFLMTNGLGGFSSLTMLGSVTRSEHALLMACTHAPNQRINLLHRMAERLEIAEEEYLISSQEFADGTCEEGFRYLSCFAYEDTPVWRFQVNGVEIQKEMGMKQGVNALGIRYEICNRGKKSCHLVLTPFFRFAPKGKDMDKRQGFIGKLGNHGWLSSGNVTLYYRTNGEVAMIRPRQEKYFYRYDTCDGRQDQGWARADHEISCDAAPGECRIFEIVYEMDQSEDTAAEIIEGLKQYREAAEIQAGFQSDMAKMLSKSALQYIAKRESTEGRTILAGYPFFEDWGRDTMIALPGLCISTRQYESAREILRTFASYEKEGLMPNLFPEGGDEAVYNTVDAALLFINCVYLYDRAVHDTAFVQEMYPVMERIIHGYRNGTRYAIHMDEDGLIAAGEGKEQLTWMDVRTGGILPTPRHGKPVEINAYWYNALRIMEMLGNTAGKVPSECRNYRELAEKVQKSFTEKFWIEEKGYLRDVISGTKADEQMRCNQIWAVSLPFTMLDAEKERRIVDAVFEKLYTPYGLRTLERRDREFHPSYGGTQFERDMAYHQGTVWVFPLGEYYLAWLKVQGCSQIAKERVKEQLEVLESAMREGCIGQLPEIYDGDNPTSSRGCFAQAWSVGELLRVYEAVE